MSYHWYKLNCRSHLNFTNFSTSIIFSVLEFHITLSCYVSLVSSKVWHFLSLVFHDLHNLKSAVWLFYRIFFNLGLTMLIIRLRVCVLEKTISEGMLCSYENADDRNIQYVLSITGDNSHDYLVKVSAARIQHCKVIFFPLSWGR